MTRPALVSPNGFCVAEKLPKPTGGAPPKTNGSVFKPVPLNPVNCVLVRLKTSQWNVNAAESIPEKRWTNTQTLDRICRMIEVRVFVNLLRLLRSSFRFSDEEQISGEFGACWTILLLMMMVQQRTNFSYGENVSLARALQLLK